jgi:hypothetical protein
VPAWSPAWSPSRVPHRVGGEGAAVGPDPASWSGSPAWTRPVASPLSCWHGPGHRPGPRSHPREGSQPGSYPSVRGSNAGRAAWKGSRGAAGGLLDASRLDVSRTWVRFHVSIPFRSLRLSLLKSKGGLGTETSPMYEIRQHPPHPRSQHAHGPLAYASATRPGSALIRHTSQPAHAYAPATPPRFLPGCGKKRPYLAR